MIFDRKKNHSQNTYSCFHLSFWSHFILSLHLFYFALFQYFHDIVLKYKPNLEVAFRLGDLPSLLMAIFTMSYVRIIGHTLPDLMT